MADPPQVSIVQDMGTVIYSDGVVASWGPEDAFLVTSPNINFIPEIVQGIITIYLRDDGAFGKHDPIQWPQLYASQYPYLAAIPKRPTAAPHTIPAPSPHSVIWNQPSHDDFLDLPNTPVRGFGRLRPQFLGLLERVVAQMSWNARQYVPPRSTIDASALRHYELEMTLAWQRLLHTSATFRDQVLQLCTVRRYWLLCSAFMTFYDLLCRHPSPEPLSVNPDLMGAWTSDPRVVQTLFSLGIPVWLVRARHVVSPDIRVAKFIGMASTAALCHVKFHGAEAVYQGLAGTRHLEVMFVSHGELMCMSRGDHDPGHYWDLSAVPTALISDAGEYASVSRSHRSAVLPERSPRLLSPSPRGGSASSSRSHKSKARYRPLPYDVSARDRSRNAHPSQVRACDKFVDITHAWMPPPLASWERAMRAVDRSDKARPGRWGYWIPEPGLLLSPKNPVRLQAYLMNWLRARPVWLYTLQLPGSAAAKLPTQVWRDFLRGVPDDPKCYTKNGKRAYDIKQIFGRVFSEEQPHPGASGEAEWHNRRVVVVDDQIGPLVMWETFELGFRYELSALDHAMRHTDSPAQEADRVALLARVFPSDSLFAVLRLPSPDSRGLFAPLPHHRIPSLNALREILGRWPLCPPEIANARPLQASDSVHAIEDLELRLACFYAQTFFDVAGRAPLVPHRCPLQAM